MIARWLLGGLLLAALAAGALSDRNPEHEPLTIGGYRVLACDFHVHMHPWSWATLTPWDSVIEARRQGLDAITLTGTNNVWTGQLGQWLSRRTNVLTVLAGQEVHTPRHHIIAVGIHSTVDWRLTAAQAIDEIHRQGGVAIAAHPIAQYWPGDSAAMRKLDAAEILQPVVDIVPEAYPQMREFFARKHLTAIGSSDYHGLNSLGMYRTYVFAQENTEEAILEALRAGRTAVYDREGHAYGDPELIRLATGLLPRAEGPPPPTLLARFSGVAGLVSLLGMIVTGFGAARRMN